MMSVFAQPDSESEELLKRGWGGKPFGFCKKWPLWQYHFTLDIGILLLYNCVCVFAVGQIQYGDIIETHTPNIEKKKTRVTVKNRIRGIKGIWEKNRETKGPINTSAKT